MPKNTKKRVKFKEEDDEKQADTFSLDKYKVKLEAKNEENPTLTADIMHFLHTNEKSEATKIRDEICKANKLENDIAFKLNGPADTANQKRKLLLENIIKQKNQVMQNRHKDKKKKSTSVSWPDESSTSIESHGDQMDKSFSLTEFNTKYREPDASKKPSIKTEALLSSSSIDFASIYSQLKAKSDELIRMKDENASLKKELENLRAQMTAYYELNSNLKTFLISNENLRIAMNEQLQELKGSTRVYCRVKPLNSGTPPCLHFPLQGIASRQLILGSAGSKPRAYYFDRVFDESSSQLMIFDELNGFIQSAFDGNFVTIFAYGQTGSGKTYTLEGTASSPGLLPRSVEKLCELAQKNHEIGQSVQLSFSCIEIYNEKARDLLSCNNSPSSETLKIITREGRTRVINLKAENFNNPQKAQEIISRSQKLRQVDKNAFNDFSSRSHCIYQLEISRSDSRTRAGKLFLIDLAGSERTSQGSDKVAVEKQKKISCEAAFINKSLTALGRIIRLMKEQKRAFNSVNLPVRESKLTHILQEAFDDNCLMLLFINVCAEEQHLAQTRESLNFGAMICS